VLASLLAATLEMFHVMYHGVWKSLGAVQQYLSMVILPSTAAYIFFGHEVGCSLKDRRGRPHILWKSIEIKWRSIRVA
jgi:hypothetical protein